MKRTLPRPGRRTDFYAIFIPQRLFHYTVPIPDCLESRLRFNGVARMDFVYLVFLAALTLATCEFLRACAWLSEPRK